MEACFLLVNLRKGMQSSSEQPLVGEEHCVTTRITAAKETRFDFEDRTRPSFFFFFFISKRPESGACQCNNITNFPFFANYNKTFGKYNVATKIFYITLFLQDMRIYTCILFYTNGCYKVVGIISCYLFR